MMHCVLMHVQAEALRIWSACCAYGICVLPLDDAYPALAAQLGCPAWARTGARAPALPRLALMVEAHRAAAEAVACNRCVEAPQQCAVLGTRLLTSRLTRTLMRLACVIVCPACNL